MALITCDTTCGIFCTKKSDKYRIKNCACRGAGLAAIDLNLVNAWTQYCNANPDASDVDAFLCNNIGGEQLYKRYGITKCDYSPYVDTPEADIEKETQERKDAQNSDLKKFAYIILLAIVCVIAWFMLSDD